MTFHKIFLIKKVDVPALPVSISTVVCSHAVMLKAKIVHADKCQIDGERAVLVSALNCISPVVIVSFW